MQTPIKLQGLCSTCNSVHGCAFRLRNPNLERWFCEEYDGSALTLKTDAKPIERLEPEPLDPHLGLCSNCESRRSCAYAHMEGGVWQCEEYR